MLIKQFTPPAAHAIFAGCQIWLTCELRPESNLSHRTSLILVREDGAQILLRSQKTVDLGPYVTAYQRLEVDGWQLQPTRDVAPSQVADTLREGVHPRLIKMVWPADTQFIVHIDCGETKDVDVSEPLPSYEAAEFWAHKQTDALNEDDSFDPTDDLLTYRIAPVRVPA